jgi:hypothetical protein
MEGITNENVPNNAESIGREEKITNAQEVVVKMFEEKFSEILERIGNNPYHRGIEQNIQ